MKTRREAPTTECERQSNTMQIGEITKDHTQLGKEDYRKSSGWIRKINVLVNLFAFRLLVQAFDDQCFCFHYGLLQ